MKITAHVDPSRVVEPSVFESLVPSVELVDEPNTKDYTQPLGWRIISREAGMERRYHLAKGGIGLVFRQHGEVMERGAGNVPDV